MELIHICGDPVTNCTAGPIDENDVFKWSATILGQDDTPYAGGLFVLSIQFPQDYPFRAPQLKFQTKIYHPNVNSNGGLSLDVMGDQWSPIFTISKLLQIIIELIAEPNPDDPLVPDIADLYQNDRPQFDANAREWTSKYAM